MCGIAGSVERHSSIGSMAENVRSMARAIAHRGPDDEGVWVSQDYGVALAHRRLSILDLSPQGHQPMLSASGRYMIVFNGEFYNYERLRGLLELQGSAPQWRGGSDTEVFLAACDAWGVEGALQRSNGMFAAAILDQHRGVLVLARDRMGEKPLYYGWQGNSLLFGSELDALRAHPAFVAERNPEAISLYFRFGYVPSPWSIYKGIFKLKPAHKVEIACRGEVAIGKPVRYWNLPVPTTGHRRCAGEAAEELDALLRDSVRMRMHSDVPMGAFLSGGIDSSTIVALMQAQSVEPIRTFSIGFNEREHDESEHARLVARSLATAHTELKVTAADALDVVPSIASVYDEPFADSSQVPTCILARLTRNYVTVALSGDAGDELFGGYHRYIQTRRLMQFYALVPGSARRLLSDALCRIPAKSVDSFLALGPHKLAAFASSDRLFKLAEVLGKDGVQDLYKRLVSQWGRPGEIFPEISEPRTMIDDPVGVASRDPLSWMMYTDQQTYLPDDILVKVDRACMRVALEARVPFLDHRVVEFAAALPLDLKLKGSEGKRLLRQVLYRYLDRKLFDRPKQGFGIPLAAWLRGPLREWAEDLLSVENLQRTGGLNVETARAAWAAHLSGRRNLHHPLWTLLMFQAWSGTRAAPSVARGPASSRGNHIERCA